MKRVASAWIVDDDDGDVFLATHYLTASGRYASVCAASDGLEALQLLKNPDLAREACPGPCPPQIVFLDINMPRMNGLELLDALEQMPELAETTVIIMLTSSRHDTDRERAMKSPLVKEYLVKPIDLQTAERIADRYGLVT